MMPALHGYALDILRVTIWLVVLGLIFIPLERLFASSRQPVLRAQIGTDLGHYFLNSLVTAAALGILLAVLGVTIYRAEPASFHALMDGLPLWTRIPATMVAGELGFYWGHRFAHESAMLWRFHAVHHSATHVDWLTNTRAHPIDMLLPRLCGFTVIFSAGLARTDASASGLVVPLIAVVTLLWGFFIHASVKWRFGCLEWIVATSALHRWHHVADEHKDKNYAAMLPVFDHLFGTLYLPRREMPQSYGCDTPVLTSWLGQMIAPFATRD